MRQAAYQTIRSLFGVKCRVSQSEGEEENNMYERQAEKCSRIERLVVAEKTDARNSGAGKFVHEVQSADSTS